MFFTVIVLMIINTYQLRNFLIMTYQNNFLFLQLLSYWPMISDDQMRVIIALTLSIPLSFLLSSIYQRNIRHLFSFTMGTLLQIYVYGIDIWLVFLFHTFVYLIIKFRSRKCGALVTILTLCILSVFHIYRMIIDYGGWTLDLSTVLMAIVCKYSLFAYAVEDGTKPATKLNPEQEKYKIEKVPPFFQYLSYCQFLPTAVIGTVIQYKHFDDYMQKKSPYDKVPSPWKKVFIDLGYSIVMLGFYVLHLLYFPHEYMRTQQFLEKGALWICAYGWISIFLVRFKYYFAWKFSLGAVHASGISYQKLEDGNENFLAVETCNPVTVESTKHLRTKITNWNMSCQHWLKRSIYERSTFKNKIYGQLLTFMVSSFWHGYYGGYYISFFFWFCQVYLSNLIFNEKKNQKSVYGKLYKKSGLVGTAFMWVLSTFLFTHFGLYFQVLSLKQGLKIMQAVYFVPSIILLMGIVFFTLMGTKGGKRSKKGEKVESKEETEKAK